MTKKPQAKYFFEVSYEVANKIGGIYTVIKSKSPEMVKYYGDNYYTIGFYNPKNAEIELIPKTVDRKLKGVFSSLEKSGIKCYYGIWNIPSKPKTILLDVSGFMGQMNNIKAELWEKYQIDSLHSDSWFDEPVVWSYATGLLLEKMSDVFKDGKIAAQFHEWMSGTGLLYLKDKKVKIGTVFTTHATMLGRSIAGGGGDLLAMADEGIRKNEVIDEFEARNYHCLAKHQTEKRCATVADCFTTVSRTTSHEARYILGRTAKVHLYNGLNLENFPAMEKLSYLHYKNKAKLSDFLRAYFEPYYNLKLEHARMIFLSGRYEFHNKGIDVFINSLGMLNERLKKEGAKSDVFAFIAIPAGVKGPKMEVLENISLFSEIENHVDEFLPEIKNKLVSMLTSGEYTNGGIANFMSEKYDKAFKKLLIAFKSKIGGCAPICAYELEYPEENDSIVSACLSAGLCNREDDSVKVVFYPRYLSAADRVIPMDYFDVIQGCSLTVFPSFYEPWGYTPVEAAASGALTLTSDLAGFGEFISERVKNGDVDGKGIYVLNMRDRAYNDICSDLSEIIYEVVNFSQQEIIDHKHNAKNDISIVDWTKLSGRYIEAHNEAVSKIK